ncbi:MAG: sulfatase-like hydrolase/transferase [Spirochaetales bacterium]
MSKSTNERRPNVVVFFTDQQRWDTTGLGGNPMGLTPNFDRMASAGTYFANTFTCQPVCGPARATLQTGLFASETGVWRNGIQLSQNVPRLASLFKDAGYTTGYIGKWHLSEKEPVPREEQVGYDYWMGANILEFTSDAYDMNLYDRDGTKHHFPGYRVDAETDVAIRFIDEHQEDPFFLFLSYIEPHHQNHIDSYPAPTGYAERMSDPWTPPDLRALGGSSVRHLPGYYGMIKRLDEALGRVEDALRSLALLENTVVLFISDHGSHFKTRNGEYKRSCHESSIRVPCFASGPGFHGGGRVEELFSLVDIPPTLADAAGLAVPSRMQGRSILPLLSSSRTTGDSRATESDWPDHVFVQISEAETGRVIRTHRWKYAVTEIDSEEPDRRTSNASADAYTEVYLYDLLHDPYELENLVHLKSHSGVRERMRSLLVERIKQIEGKSPRIIEAESVDSGQRRVAEYEVSQ